MIKEVMKKISEEDIKSGRVEKWKVEEDAKKKEEAERIQKLQQAKEDDRVELKVAERLRKAQALMNPDVIMKFYLDEMKQGDNKKKVDELLK